MTKLGTKKRPIIARVHSEEKAKYVAQKCAENNWHYIIGFEPDKPEDISDLEKLLNPPEPLKSTKLDRNAPCPCGSGKNTKNAVELAEHQYDSPNKCIQLTAIALE